MIFSICPLNARRPILTHMTGFNGWSLNGGIQTTISHSDSRKQIQTHSDSFRPIQTLFRMPPSLNLIQNGGNNSDCIQTAFRLQQYEGVVSRGASAPVIAIGCLNYDSIVILNTTVTVTVMHRNNI